VSSLSDDGVLVIFLPGLPPGALRLGALKKRLARTQ